MKRAQGWSQRGVRKSRNTVSRKFAALDASFILALAAGSVDAEGVIDWLNTYNVYPLVTPSVLQALVDIEECGDSISKSFAIKGKDSLTTWGILNQPLTPLEHGIALAISHKLFAANVLSEPLNCQNDGLVLAEAAIQCCSIFITYRMPLLQTNAKRLKLTLLQCDVSDLFVIDPPTFVEATKEVMKEKEDAPL